MIGATVLAVVCAPALGIIDRMTGGSGELAGVGCCLSMLVLAAGLALGKVKFFG